MGKARSTNYSSLQPYSQTLSLKRVARDKHSSLFAHSYITALKTYIPIGPRCGIQHTLMPLGFSSDGLSRLTNSLVALLFEQSN